MKFIDIHCHLDFKEYGKDREDVIIKRTLALDVGMINVGVDVETSKAVVELAHTYQNMWAIVGVHPVDNKEAVDYKKLKELALDPKVVGIGECGFDFMHEGPEDLIDNEKFSSNISNLQMRSKSRSCSMFETERKIRLHMPKRLNF
jgi:TatD DNase family protein